MITLSTFRSMCCKADTEEIKGKIICDKCKKECGIFLDTENYNDEILKDKQISDMSIL